jgi:hypothetical protein
MRRRIIATNLGLFYNFVDLFLTVVCTVMYIHTNIYVTMQKTVMVVLH